MWGELVDSKNVLTGKKNRLWALQDKNQVQQEKHIHENEEGMWYQKASETQWDRRPGSTFHNDIIRPHPTDMNLLISHIGVDAVAALLVQHLGTTTNTDV